jgi:hypothetical protein
VIVGSGEAVAVGVSMIVLPAVEHPASTMHAINVRATLYRIGLPSPPVDRGVRGEAVFCSLCVTTFL